MAKTIIQNMESMFTAAAAVACSTLTDSLTLAAGCYDGDTTAAVMSVTLPAAPASGDAIIINDTATSFATNNVTINTGGNPVENLADSDCYPGGSFALDVDNGSWTFTFDGAKWVLSGTTVAQVCDPPDMLIPACSGSSQATAESVSMSYKFHLEGASGNADKVDVRYHNVAGTSFPITGTDPFVFPFGGAASERPKMVVSPVSSQVYEYMFDFSVASSPVSAESSVLYTDGLAGTTGPVTNSLDFQRPSALQTLGIGIGSTPNAAYMDISDATDMASVKTLLDKAKSLEQLTFSSYPAPSGLDLSDSGCLAFVSLGIGPGALGGSLFNTNPPVTFGGYPVTTMPIMSGCDELNSLTLNGNFTGGVPGGMFSAGMGVAATALVINVIASMTDADIEAFLMGLDVVTTFTAGAQCNISTLGSSSGTLTAGAQTHRDSLLAKGMTLTYVG